MGKDFREKWIEYTGKTKSDFLDAIEKILEEMKNSLALVKVDNNLYSVSETTSFEDYAVKNIEMVNIVNKGNLCEINLLSDDDFNFGENICNKYYEFLKNINFSEENSDEEEEIYAGKTETEKEFIQEDNSDADDYEPGKEDKFAFEFIEKYIEHYFFGGNGKIVYSSVKSLIDFCEKIIDDANFCLENNEIENGGYAITDAEKIRELLVIRPENRERNVYQSLNRAVLGKDIVTQNYFIMKGSILPPLTPSSQKKVVKERSIMMEQGYLTEQNDGNFRVNKTYIFPQNASLSQICSVCVEYNTSGQKKIKI